MQAYLANGILISRRKTHSDESLWKRASENWKQWKASSILRKQLFHLFFLQRFSSSSAMKNVHLGESKQLMSRYVCSKYNCTLLHKYFFNPQGFDWVYSFFFALISPVDFCRLVLIWTRVIVFDTSPLHILFISWRIDSVQSESLIVIIAIALALMQFVTTQKYELRLDVTWFRLWMCFFFVLERPHLPH